MLKNNKTALIIIGIAVFIKLFLFVYMTIFSPQGRILPDSADYLNTGAVLATQGAFAKVNSGVLQYELFRTPGYSLFLCIFHYLMKIPLAGIVFLQLLLAIGVAFITYQVAFEIDKKTAFLSGVIVLYSPPITTSALLILSDTLFVFLVSLFTLAFVRYLKFKATKLVALAAILLALATYVRPVSYYLGFLIAIFILYANLGNNFFKAIFQTIIFLLVVYSLLGIWQLRNYAHIHRFIFTSIQTEYRTFPIFKAYAMNSFLVAKGSWPGFSYISAAGHCFLSLLARPGTLKYLHSYSVSVAGKIFGYPFLVFWWVGFLVGLIKLKVNIFYQFIFLTIAYFIFLTIAVIAASCGERYLVPMVPLIAVISAAGWIKLKDSFIQGKSSLSMR